MEKVETILPYAGSGATKTVQVETMFDNIAPKYDLLNHTLSVGIDKIWRNVACKILLQDKPDTILDIAAGTGDFSLLAAKKSSAHITALDLSQAMLNIARQKAIKAKLDNNISFVKGDSLNLPFDNNTFDCVSVAFGVRNFEDIRAGLNEIFRVLKPGGRIVVLELAEPDNKIVKSVYNIYFKHFLPLLGKWVSKDDQAYKYLPRSVDNFPYGKPFLNIMNNCNFSSTQLKKLSCGLAVVYNGIK